MKSSLCGLRQSVPTRSPPVWHLQHGFRRQLAKSTADPAWLGVKGNRRCFGSGAKQVARATADGSRTANTDSGEHAGSSGSEARVDAVEARLLRKLEAGSRADDTPSASSSGRAAAERSEPGPGRARRAQPERLRAQATAAATGVGPAKAGRNAAAKGGAPRERAAAPVKKRAVAAGDGLSKRQERRLKKLSGLPTERLSKVLARAGVASRRVAEEIIESGKVRVNGEVVLVPQHQVVQTADTILVEGKPLLRNVPRLYFAVNKPKGYLCASSAAPNAVGAKKLIIDLFAEWAERLWTPAHPRMPTPRLFTVGRLDVASTGLIFVTNDGHWAQRVQHPSAGVTKEYLVSCTGPVSRRQLETIAAGTVVKGAMVVPVAVAPVVDQPGDRTRLRVVVAEGRKHEVRELVAHAGLDVAVLKRVRVGGYRLPRDLGIGQVRELKPHEVRRVLDLGAQNNNPDINPYFTSALPSGAELRSRVPA